MRVRGPRPCARWALCKRKRRNPATKMRGRSSRPDRLLRGVGEANLGESDQAVESFVTFLDIRLEPRRSIGGTTPTRPSPRSRKRETGCGPLSVARGHLQIVRAAAGGVRAGLGGQVLGDGPVRWILTVEEKKEWSKPADPNAREAFVERFWTARSTLPGSSGRSVSRKSSSVASHLPTRSVSGGGATRKPDRPRYGCRSWALRRLRVAGAPAKRGGSERVLRPVPGRVRGGQNRDKVRFRGILARGDGRPPCWRVTRGRRTGPLHGRRVPRDVVLRCRDVAPRDSGRPVDVHYVTKRGGGKNVLQRDIASNSALGAARQQAGPQPGPSRSRARRSRRSTGAARERGQRFPRTAGDDGPSASSASILARSCTPGGRGGRRRSRGRHGSSAVSLSRTGTPSDRTIRESDSCGHPEQWVGQARMTCPAGGVIVSWTESELPPRRAAESCTISWRSTSWRTPKKSIATVAAAARSVQVSRPEAGPARGRRRDEHRLPRAARISPASRRADAHVSQPR